MSRWLKWNGGPCPVHPDSLVRVRIRCLSRSDAEKRAPTAAKGWRWTHKNCAGDIVAFEQTGQLA